MSQGKYPTSTPHDVVCLYHASCMDGLVSAALVNRYFKGQVECVAARYQEEPPLELMRGKHVYLVDFTYPPEVLLPHVDSFASLHIIDHHADAVKPWLDYDWTADVFAIENVYVTFDNAKSGAMLVWDHFFGNSLTSEFCGKPTPILIQYTQEYDLWTKELPMTDEVQSALRSRFPPHKAQLAELADFIFNATDADVIQLQEEGKVILAPERNIAEGLIRRHLQFIDFLDYKNIPVCFMPAELVNMAGEMIYTRYPEVPFVVMFEDNYVKKTRKYSFRSPRNGGANVSRIAARLGGKGHYNSAGAMVPMDHLVFEQEVIITTLDLD